MENPEKQKWLRGNRRKLVLFFTLCIFIVIKCVLVITYNIGVERKRKHNWSSAMEFYHNSLADSNMTNQWMVVTNYTTFHSNETLNFTSLNQARENTLLGEFNCSAMFAGNKTEMQRAQTFSRDVKRISISDVDYNLLTSNCEHFRRQRGYIMHPLTLEEATYPIAYSILMYKDVEQVERLLRAIYMPQNIYCIHVDLKAANQVHIAMRSIVDCFPNVFISSRLENVQWGHISLVYAEMNCMRDLLRYKWNYLINLTGQMFPLQTNLQLVQILKLLNGSNDIEGTIKR